MNGSKSLAFLLDEFEKMEFGMFVLMMDRRFKCKTNTIVLVD